MEPLGSVRRKSLKNGDYLRCFKGLAQSGGEMTRDQMRGEHDRLQGVLEAHEARAIASSIPDHHAGLRQRIAGLALKLAETNGA